MQPRFSYYSFSLVFVSVSAVHNLCLRRCRDTRKKIMMLLRLVTSSRPLPLLKIFRGGKNCRLLLFADLRCSAVRYKAIFRVEWKD